MDMKLFGHLFLILFLGFADLGLSQDEMNHKSNIILIIADDLGYGDISSFGGETPTPNIDLLAEQGLKFTDFHTNGANCSPTRAALLTGRYQQRMGIEGALGEYAEGLGSELAKNEITMADYLKKAGYKTALVGKWHLGYNQAQSPVQFGFDEFRGMLHGATDYHSHINTFGRFDWWHNQESLKEEGYVTDLVTKNSIDLIEKWKDKSFFLVVSHLAIHFPWQTPDDKAHRVEGKSYRGIGNELLSRHGQHPPEQYSEIVQTMIEELDKSVGEIIQEIYNNHIDKETVVFFLSDNGGIIKQSGYPVSSNGVLKGAKHSLYEGGHRVPAIAWWPGRIEAGIKTDETVMTMDILPTLLDLTDIPLPDYTNENRLDGVSFAHLLLHNQAMPARTLFWKIEDEIAIRSGDWKLILTDTGNPPELYNVRNDISEEDNIADKYPGMVRYLSVQSELFNKDVSGFQ